MPVPQDLLALLTAATTRYASGLLRIVRTGPQEPAEAYGLTLPDFGGWTFPEHVVIARYRAKTG